MNRKVYRILKDKNNIVSCLNENEVKAILTEISDTSQSAFDNIEVYDPGSGWRNAKSWLVNQNSSINKLIITN